jgi:hypothetical protein
MVWRVLNQWQGGGKRGTPVGASLYTTIFFNALTLLKGCQICACRQGAGL